MNHKKIYRRKFCSKNETIDKEVLKKIDAVEHKIQKSIDFYKKYGSENW